MDLTGATIIAHKVLRNGIKVTVMTHRNYDDVLQDYVNSLAQEAAREQVQFTSLPEEPCTPTETEAEKAK